MSIEGSKEPVSEEFPPADKWELEPKEGTDLGVQEVEKVAIENENTGEAQVQIESLKEGIDKGFEAKETNIEGDLVVKKDKNTSDQGFLLKEDSEYQSLTNKYLKWRNGYGCLGGKLETAAKNLQIVGGIGGGLVAAPLGSAFYIVTTGGLILTNPVTLAGLGVASASIAVGEGIKMYRRHKEAKYESARDERRNELIN